MENQNENILVNEMENSGKRPQFLNVLCILSFICVGLMIILTLLGIVMNTPERMAANVERVREVSPSKAQQMELAIAEQQDSTMAKIQPYLTILFEIISLLGVIQMFNLKRAGFFIYSAAELAPYVLLIFQGKKAINMMAIQFGEGGAIAFMVIAGLFDLAFVTMYALNLKHLKK